MLYPIGSRFLLAIALLASVKAADRADEYLGSCKEKLRNGDRKSAIAACTAALRANPNYAEAYYERGRAYVDYGKKQEEKAKSNAAALNDYSKAIALNSSYSEAYLARGYLRRTQMKDLDGALQDLTKGIDLAGTGWSQFWATKSAVLEFRAAARKDKGDLEGALSDYSAAITSHQGKDLDVLYAKRAAVRKEKGDFDGAISDLTYASLGQDASSYRGRAYIRNLADMKKGKGDLDGAIGDLTHLIRLGSSASDYRSRGELRRTKGDLEGAITDFTSALLVDPCYADAWTSRARARGANGDAAGSQADSAQAKQLTGGDNGLQGLVGSGCERAFTFEAPVFVPGAGTMIAMPDGTILPNNSPAAQNFLRNKEQELAIAAQSDQEKRDYPGAAFNYTKAIKLGLDDPALYYRRGYVRQAMGDIDGGIGDFSETIRLSESRKLTVTVLGASVSFAALVYDSRGEAKAKVGDVDGAVEDFTKAIGLQPDYPSAYEHRSAARRSKGDLTGAEQDLAAAGRLKAASGHR